MTVEEFSLSISAAELMHTQVYCTYACIVLPFSIINNGKYSVMRITCLILSKFSYRLHNPINS